MTEDEAPPIFTAVSSSARQLHLLLRCINISPKAQVQISEHGLRFSVEDSSVMEAMVFLERSLFTSFTYNAPPRSRRSSPEEMQANSDHEDEIANEFPTFSISLPALLETLQIFGATDSSKGNLYGVSRDSAFPHAHAFSATVLGISSLCRLTYHSAGSPLAIVLTENSVTTTCELVTYEPAVTTDIPFSRQRLALKVIMRGAYLHDAVSELAAATTPHRLLLRADARAGTFTLAAASELGSALVEFHRDAGTHHTPATLGDVDPNDDDAHAPAKATGLLETFQVSQSSFAQVYTFAHVARAKRAMAAATKVSIRADEQGVLSLQFMVENLEPGGAGVGGGGGASVSFIDFRFVPMVREEGDDEDGEGGEDEED